MASRSSQASGLEISFPISSSLALVPAKSKPPPEIFKPLGQSRAGSPQVAKMLHCYQALKSWRQSDPP